MTLWWTADNLDLNDNISIKWQSSNTSELHLQCCSWLNVPGFTPPLGEIPLSEHACDASASSRWSCRMCLSDNTWHFKTLLPQYQSMNQVVCVEHCSSAVYKNRYVKWCYGQLTGDLPASLSSIPVQVTSPHSLSRLATVKRDQTDMEVRQTKQRNTEIHQLLLSYWLFELFGIAEANGWAHNQLDIWRLKFAMIIVEQILVCG